MSEELPSLSWKRVVRRFRRSLRTATGEFATRESIVIRLTGASGRAGYGEISPWPGFPVETLDAAESALRQRVSDATHDASRGSSTPCLDFALATARAWAAGDFQSDSAVSFRCAGLLRNFTEASYALRMRDSGYAVLKLKIGGGVLRDEQRDVAGLVRALGPGVALRLDANGSLTGKVGEAWCDFLSEYPEIEWLEQPFPPGEESRMRELAEKSGVADRIALDESACRAETLPADWPGIVAVKPLLLGDPGVWRSVRGNIAPGRLAYASVFETPFGRQAALALAAEAPGNRAVGFGTLGVFDDNLDAHEAGPVASTLVRDEGFWEDLWNRL